MKHVDLAKTANRFAKYGGPKKPREFDLREVVAAIYQAYFHAVRCAFADLRAGATPAVRASKARYLAYRFLQRRIFTEMRLHAGKMREFPEETGNSRKGIIATLKIAFGPIKTHGRDSSVAGSWMVLQKLKG